MPLHFAGPAVEAYTCPASVRHLLDGLRTRAGDHRIVYREQASYSYREFECRIGRLAAFL